MPTTDATTTSAPASTTQQLPRTGSNTGFPLAFGLSCLVAGGLLVIRKRGAWSHS